MPIAADISRMDTRHGGRFGARRVLVLASAMLGSVTMVQSTGAQPAPVTVREARGVYTVTAAFATEQPAAVVHAVLTDYEAIPRYMPDVRSSRVLERGESRTVIAQEAVAKVLFFSKTVHLVLEVDEAPTTIAFRDRCGSSFTRYEGRWTLREEGGRTQVAYELAAKPAFDVPEFLLSRLLRRDADRMIERLRREITARGQLARR
jgi:ribosome-associated toxin RatA of RatAB toxin-antitoxin module